MPGIHPTAVIDPAARLADNVTIGPHVVIDGPVQLDSGVQIIAQAHLTGHCYIGPDTVIHPFAAIGGPPQDRAYGGEPTEVHIGARCIIREGVTIHRGTGAGARTEIGDDCMLMATSHVAHNCRVEHHVTIINAALLAGHVQVGHHAVIGGDAGIHQFVRIGEYTMLGGGCKITQDAPPYSSFVERNCCIGINRIGLVRNGFTSEQIDELRWLHRKIFRGGQPIRAAALSVREEVKTPPGHRLLEFVLADSKRGIGGAERPRGPRNAD